MSSTRIKHITKGPRLKLTNQHKCPLPVICVCSKCGQSLQTEGHVCIMKERSFEIVIDREMSCSCHQCGKLFTNFASFKVHQSMHEWGVTSVLCDFCGRLFVDEVKLHRHKQRTHWKLNLLTHQCELCGFSAISLQHIVNHMKSHLGTSSLGFESKTFHTDHMKATHQNVCPYSCQFCGQQFQKKKNLNDHNKREHARKKPNSGSKSPEECISVKLESVKFVHSVKRPDSGSKSPEEYVPAKLEQIKPVHSVKRPDTGSKSPEECVTAKLELVKPAHRVKKQRKQYSCQLCNNRPFLDKTCLTVHMASTHSDEKPYMCHICGKGFKLKNGLRFHTQTHSEERPYECSICDSVFKCTKDLRKHQERHKTSKDHLCNICGKGFMTRNDVYLHQKVHDPTRDHRLYKPGVYKVSGGELVTARTRKNKLSLKEQEPISFDTEINGHSTLTFENSPKKESNKSHEIVARDVATNVLSVGDKNEALSSHSLTFETFLNTSHDTNEFCAFASRENTNQARSLIHEYISNSNDSTQVYKAPPSDHGQLAAHDGWSSAELLEDYDWLDSPSTLDDTGVNSPSDAVNPSPAEDYLVAIEQVHVDENGDSCTPAQEGVNLMQSEDSQSIEGIHSFTSSLQEFPDFDSHEEEDDVIDDNVGDHKEEDKGTFCDSDVDMQSLNKYLNGELNESQRLNLVNMRNNLHNSLQSAGYGRSSCQGMNKSNNSLKTSHDRRQDVCNEDGRHDPCNTQDGRHDPCNFQDGRHYLCKTQDGRYNPSNTQDGRHDPCNTQNGRHDLCNIQDGRHNPSNTQDRRQDPGNMQGPHTESVNTNDVDSFETFNRIFATRNREISISRGGQIESSVIYQQHTIRTGDLDSPCTSDRQTKLGKENHLLIDFHMASSDMFNDTSDIYEDNNTLNAESVTSCILKNKNGQNAVTFAKEEPICNSSHLTEREIYEETAEQQDPNGGEIESCQVVDTPLKHRKRENVVEVASEHDELAHGIVRFRQQKRQAAVFSFKCSTCAATLNTRDDWKHHKTFCRISSSNKTQFKCGDCGRSYTNQSNLKTHQAACHSENSNHFVCHMCGHMCNNKQNLGRHMVRHSSARPFKCDVCQKCFKTKESIRAHLRQHLPCKMLYKCNRCDKFYNHLNSLQAHKQTHLPVSSLFMCTICSKQLSDKSNLAAHIKRHLVPRFYSCPVCSKQLSSVHSLQSHQGPACLKYQLKKVKIRQQTESLLAKAKGKQQSETIKLRSETKKKSVS